jgi:hypothetical protein
MPVTIPGLNAAAAGVAAIAVQVSVHSGNPGATGANEITGGGYARITAVWDPSLGGLVLLSSPAVFSGPPGQPVAYIGLWTTAGGTWLGGVPAVLVSGILAFNDAGQLNLDSLGVRFRAAGTAFILGETRPNATNTGLIGPTTSTNSGTTNLTFSTNDQVIEDVRFERRISVACANPVFRNCDFAGFAAGVTNFTDLVNCTSTACVNARFEFCRFRPMTPSQGWWDNCIRGHDFTLHRCDLSGTVDGAQIHATPSTSTTIPANVLLEGSYFHDWAFWCPYADTPDNRTHNDCVQLNHSSGHRGVVGIGNSFEGFLDPSISTYSPPTFSGGVQTGGYIFYNEFDVYGQRARWLNSCIMHAPEGSPAGEVRWERNWFDGAAVKIGYPTFGTGTTFGSPGFQVLTNRLGRNSRGAGDFQQPNPVPPGHIAKRNSCPVVISGNQVIDLVTGEVIGDYNSFTSLGA